MGWFDRKTPDIEDVIAKPNPQPRPAQKPAAKPAAQAAKPAAKPAASPAKQPAASSTAAKSMSSSEFGIQKAIELMRNLPADNIPLVVQVVRTTLESANVSVEAIISDAEIKQAKIENRIESLEKEIKEYEEEIAARRDEISALKADFKETSGVRDKLELSLKPANAGGIKAPATKAASAPKSDDDKADAGLSPSASASKIKATKIGSIPGIK